MGEIFIHRLTFVNNTSSTILNATSLTNLWAVAMGFFTAIISGSVTNDGTYTVSSVSYGPTTSGYTIVYVNEDVATSDSTGNASNFLLSSQTVELDFGEDLHLRYAWMILSILGIRVSFQELVQYSEGMQQKDKQE